MDNNKKILEKVIIKDDVYFDKNIAVNENGIISNVLGVGDGMAVGGNINLENVNIYGLMSIFKNTYSQGDIYISKENNDKFVYLEGDGKVTCDDLKMLNKVSISNYRSKNIQEEESVLINATEDNLIGNNKGLYINPVREDNDEIQNVLIL